MSTVKKINISNLPNFSRDKALLSIVERDVPEEANKFFKNLLLKPFNINQKVYKKSSFDDIKRILDKTIKKKIEDNIFYNEWIKDMAKVSVIFCNILKTESIILSLESSRSCKRYHIDNVPMRLLVTYYGKGTEWLPSHACDYSAYYNGEKNEKIVKDTKQVKFVEPWDIAIFKGQQFQGVNNGILHRTPNVAQTSVSLLMRLDNSSYLS